MLIALNTGPKPIPTPIGIVGEIVLKKGLSIGMSSTPPALPTFRVQLDECAAVIVVIKVTRTAKGGEEG